jgi:hypothetical protein
MYLPHCRMANWLVTTIPDLKEETVSCLFESMEALEAAFVRRHLGRRYLIAKETAECGVSGAPAYSDVV